MHILIVQQCLTSDHVLEKCKNMQCLLYWFKVATKLIVGHSRTGSDAIIGNKTLQGTVTIGG